jgi:hypothetical protein
MRSDFLVQEACRQRKSVGMGGTAILRCTTLTMLGS